jgi:dipeptidyl aminopeptidase/acylaminoacyl peptidase
MRRLPLFSLGARASSPVLLSLVFLLPAFSQAKHPFTFEDMMALKRVEEPVVSPDGKWVLFTALDVDLKANTKTPHVWVVALNPSEGAEKAGSSTEPSDSQANHSASVGMTKEKEIISDQDADRPRWAPDGKRFAFVSTKENGSQIWIAEFDGATGTVTAKHRLTNIATEASGELWSPDGKNILFESDVYPECDGAPAAEAECNAKKVEEKKNSKVKAQIFAHLLYRHWNAYKEGKRTHLFVVAVDGCGTSHVGAGALTRPAERSSAESGEQSSPARTRASGPTRDEEGSNSCSIARDLTPGDYDAPVFSLGGQDDYAFSPDGKEICYASNHDAMPAASTNNDLFTVPVDWPADATSAQVLAATKDITAENKAADNTPLYSPDGKYIAYRAQQRPGYESDRWRLMLYDRKMGERRNLTENWDRWVGSFAWTPDSNQVYLSADNEGGAPIYRTTVDSHPGPGEFASGFNGDLTITPDGEAVLFTQMSTSSPNEISYAPTTFFPCEVEIAGKGNRPRYTWLECELSKSQPLTHVNDLILSEVSMSPLETFWFTGAHDDKVQGWILKPPNFDPNKKYPVKFIVHGGPEVPFGDEWSYRWNFELFAANGYVVVFINFHGSPGYGQKFIDAINGDWGGAPFEDLMKGLDYAEQHYAFIDKDRECALGASYGGYMVNWIMGHTNRFKCIVSHDGMFNTESAWGDTEELWFNEWEFKGTPYTNREMYRKWSPHLFATNFKTPTLVIHSQLDYRLDVSQGFDLFTTLQRQGVPSKMLYFPDEGHWVLKPQNSQLWYKTVNEWVDQWIGGR